MQSIHMHSLRWLENNQMEMIVVLGVAIKNWGEYGMKLEAIMCLSMVFV